MKDSLNLVKSYVPRHLRLGVCCDSPIIKLHQDIVESIPIVRDDSSIVSEQKVLKSVPASEVMSKFKTSAFRLSALVKNGVPLKMVNINNSSSFTISQLQEVCSSIERTEDYYSRIESEKKERESWFKGFDENSSVVDK